MRVVKSSCPIPGSVPSWVGWSLEQSGLWPCNLPAGQPPSRPGEHQACPWSPTAPQECTSQLWEGAACPFHFSFGSQTAGLLLLLLCFTALFPVPHQGPVVLGSSSSKSAETFWNFRLALSFLLQFTPIYHFALSPLPKQVPELTGNVTFYTMDVLFASEDLKYFSNNSVPLNKLKRNLSGCG